MVLHTSAAYGVTHQRLVDKTGIEPAFLLCKSSVFPLDDKPIDRGVTGLEPATSPLTAVTNGRRPIPWTSGSYWRYKCSAD